MKLIIDRPSMAVAVADSLVVSRFGTTTLKDLDELLHLQPRVTIDQLTSVFRLDVTARAA
jgi:hypothetical protein